MKRERLDRLLVERGFVSSREKAQAAILAGKVLVGGQVVFKPDALIDPEAPIALKAKEPYVSRGGLKLKGALATFGIKVEGRICLDVGASTGGFTDCLLQEGAKRVYAVDVGYGQLHHRLRQDPRVVVLERTNIRYLLPETLPERPDLATIDVSFISLSLVLPPVVALLEEPVEIVALVKPQFEVGKGQVGKGGVVKDPEKHRAVLLQVGERAEALGLRVLGITPSPLLGPKGNREFFIHLIKGSASRDLLPLVEAALAA
ncbi:MAG: TlyA family RNA methyltransferase [Candidatus Methylomirabilales bacterium]